MQYLFDTFLKGFSIVLFIFHCGSISAQISGFGINSPYLNASESNTYYIDNHHHIRVQDKAIQIIDSRSNVISSVLERVNDKTFPESIYLGEVPSHSDEFSDGWMTYAECSIYGINPPTINEFRSKWIVPSPPIERSGQLLYLFISLMTIEEGRGHIVQPVLQWGTSPAGGGQYWSVCNWYVTSDNLFFHDSLVQVNPGDTIEGSISLISNYNNLYSYKSAFTLHSSERNFLVENLPELLKPHIVLEAYNVNNCNEYPLDEKLRFTNIQIQTENDLSDGYQWILYPGLNSCNQYTRLANSSLENGQIDIHFHSPSTINNYEKLHLYPNPVDGFLHISFVEPVYNCLIKVYDNSGKLLFEELKHFIDYEFNLNFQKQKKGIYIVNFLFSEYMYSNSGINLSYKIVKK